MRILALALLAALVGVTSSAAAQARVRLPAAFYDIEIRESLTSGTSARMGGPGGIRASASSQTATGGFTVPESHGMSQFIISADSMLFRSGRDIIELAIAEFTGVEEVRAMGRADLAWVRIQYTRAGVAKEMFVRRYQTRNQAELLAALQAAMARHAERQAQTPPPR